MRVAFVSTGYYPTHSGGGSISTRLITDTLRSEGIDVDVFTTTGDGKSGRQISEDHYEIPSGSGYRLPKRVGRNYGAFKNLPDLSEYDLVHVYGIGSLPGTVLWTDVPVLGTVNNLDWVCINWTGYLRHGCPDYGIKKATTLAWEDGYRATLPLKLGMDAFFKKIATRTDCFTVQTQGMKGILSRCGYPENKLKVVPNLLDPRFCVEPTQEENKLIYVGRLTEKKGVDDIVEVFTKLSSSERNGFVLEVYGSGPLEDRLRELSSETDTVRFGYCPYEDLPEVYRNADVLVHGSKYPEPFSRTWLEAMASETAILCSENPSSTDVLQNIAEYYDPFNRRSLRQSLQEVISDGELRSEMATRGKKAVSKYKPEKVVAQYVSIYEDMCS